MAADTSSAHDKQLMSYEECAELLSEIKVCQEIDLGSVTVYQGSHHTFGPILLVLNSSGESAAIRLAA